MRGSYLVAINRGGFETNLGDIGGVGITISIDVMGVCGVEGGEEMIDV